MKAVILFIVLISTFVFTGCGGAANNSQNLQNTNTNSAKPAAQNLTVGERPQKIKDLMAARGEQDAAAPTIKVLEPKANATLTSSVVKVKLEIGGDLKGYMPGMNEETHTGNHIHVILDNQPYEAYYNLGSEFELRNVVDGEHTLRVFPSRPWHESYKNEGAFQIIKFTVKGGGADKTKPTTTANGNTMANANTEPKPTPEGKEMQNSTAGPVDAAKPLLTYSRPKGEYKGEDTNAVMIDFWLSNAKLTGDGGEYRVSWSVNGGEAKFIEKWEPIWITGWAAGKHKVVLTLVDKDGKIVDNGGFNATVREITITK
ncbi:MAG: hypothetical protein ABL952_04870 [Pyrinomonadaceae bacterium]